MSVKSGKGTPSPARTTPRGRGPVNPAFYPKLNRTDKNIGPDIFSKYTPNLMIFLEILLPSKCLILSHKKYPPL